MESENYIIVDNDYGVGVFSDGSSVENSLSSDTVSAVTVSDIEIYEPAFIGFGLAGAGCLMCYGMIAIMKLFKSVM